MPSLLGSVPATSNAHAGFGLADAASREHNAGGPRDSHRISRARERAAQFFGHFWTVRPFVTRKFKPSPPPASRHIRATVVDPRRGPVRITGRLSTAEQAGHRKSDTLVVAVHGLGGNHESYSVIDLARSAMALGLDCLRLNLRGADLAGNDYYHAGLTADLEAMLASDIVAPYRRILLAGISMGGHLSLRYAAGETDPRVSAVAAICPPIDLAAGVAEIDQPKGRMYRRVVLDALKETYRAVASQGPVPLPVADADRIRTIRDWDDLIIAPRHGFESAEDYWANTTVGPMLERIETPTLVVTTAHDPMVFSHTVWPALEECDSVQSVFLRRGGHVGFPPRVDLGFGNRGSVETQALSWMLDRSRNSGRAA